MGKDALHHYTRQILTPLKEWLSRPDVLTGIVLSSVCINLLSLAFPLSLLQIYDRIIPNQAYATLNMIVLLTAVAMLFEGIMQVLRDILTSRIDARFDYLTSCEAFHALNNTSLETFEKEGAGSHLEKLNSLNRLRNFYGGQALTTALDLPFVLLFLYFIYSIGGSMVLVPIGLFAVFALISWVLGMHMRENIEDMRKADDRRINYIIETLAGIHTIKALAMEPLMQRRYERLLRAASECDYDLSLKNSTSQALSSFFSQANLVLVVTFGSIMAISGSLTIGAVAACSLLSNRTLLPLTRALAVWKKLQTIMVAQDRLNEILKLTPEQENIQHEHHKIIGKIELENVTYQPKPNRPAIIDQISLDISPGEAIAITGENDTAKNALVSLLMGLYQPTSGQLAIDDIPLHEYDLQHYRQQIGYLPEHGHLFHGTILENINLFNPDCAHEDIVNVSRALGIETSINHLPQGYATMIGTRAIEYLPSSLRQRIAMSRSLVKKPRIIIFDEANSSFDMPADNQLKHMLSSLKRKATLIIISKRPSVTRIADRVFTLEQGKLKENRQDARRVG